MGIHADFGVSPDCRNTASCGEICVKCNQCARLGPHYVDATGRLFFVSTRQGQTWAVYAKRPTGSVRRIRSVPLAATRQEAEYNLDYWARGRGLRIARRVTS